jgi:hypothetical protein
MRNDLNRGNDDLPERGDRPRRGVDQTPQLSDREVPLGSAATADVINRWLDGESVDASALRGDAARHVEFWRRIGEETDRRHQMVTPAHVPAQIMAAIHAEASLSLETATPWYRRTIEVSTAAALLAAGALVIFGSLVGALLR